MSTTYIAAHTPGNGYRYYPPFLNISRDDQTGEIVVILRSNESADGTCGASVEARFKHNDFALFLAQAVSAIIGSLGSEVQEKAETINGLRAAFEATKTAP